MSNLHNQFNEIEESLKYVVINATILNRFITPDKPLTDDNEILDYWDHPNIKNVLTETSKDLLNLIDELSDEINNLKKELVDTEKEKMRDSLENIFNQE